MPLSIRSVWRWGHLRAVLHEEVSRYRQAEALRRYLPAARALAAEVVEDVHVHPNACHRELWLRDLDGYVVVSASPEGEAGS